MAKKIVTRFFNIHTKETIKDDANLYRDEDGSVIEVTKHSFGVRIMPDIGWEETPEEIALPKTREEHLKWCKERAIRYLDEDDVETAIKSFLSDMSKHEETKEHPMLFSLVMMPLKQCEAYYMIKDFN